MTYTVAQLRAQLRRPSDAVRVYASAFKQAREEAAAAEAMLAARQQAAELAAETHALLVRVSEASRAAVRQRIERVVSAMLGEVFGRSVTFRIDTEVKRGQVEMTPAIGYSTPSGVVLRGVDDVGGGVVDVVAFGLRLSVLAMHGTTRPVLVADEPFRHVSADLMPRVSAIVRKLSEALGVQLIIVSHEPEIAGAAHRVFAVTRDARGSSIVRTENGVPWSLRT